MQTAGTKKRIPNVILDLFSTTFNGHPFHAFRVGDPIDIPQSMLPALIVHEPNTKYNWGPTGFDDIEHDLILMVIFNKKDEMGRPDDAATLDETLDDLIQGRDETTGDFLPNTIMGVLRKNVTLGNLIVDQIGTVEKMVIQRTETLITQEVHISLTITELQSVAGRS